MKTGKETGRFRLIRRKPEDAKHLVGSRWVYALKRNQHGIVTRYKARMVAQGFSQRGGLNYTETFAPVTKHTTVRSTLALCAANPHCVLRQGDMSTAYLNSGLRGERIIMVLPRGFVGPNGESTETGWVALLDKTLHGLKQSGRYWYELISSELAKLGFQPSRSDPCCFVMRSETEYCRLVLYVDDFFLCGTPEIVDRIEISQLSLPAALTMHCTHNAP